MRKKLEAELISIAHRILKMKHKDDVRELHHETQKLYEKLSVLLFVEENFDEVKPTIVFTKLKKNWNALLILMKKLLLPNSKRMIALKLNRNQNLKKKRLKKKLKKHSQKKLK